MTEKKLLYDKGPEACFYFKTLQIKEKTPFLSIESFIQFIYYVYFLTNLEIMKENLQYY